jgi:Ca2+-binding RTX toxin-like protein
MNGGPGDDSYIVGAGDVVSEAPGGGIDTVYSSLPLYTLTANVETGALIGGGALIGNNLANTLIGDAGANILSGLGGGDFLIGGAGGDILVGGGGLDIMQGNTGADVFWWTGLGDLGDIIQDWTNDDQLQFTVAPFFQIPGGALVAGVNFIANTAPSATTANASFLWDTDDTALYFDPDGTGPGGLLLVADLQAFTTVTTADFQFV